MSSNDPFGSSETSSFFGDDDNDFFGATAGKAHDEAPPDGDYDVRLARCELGTLPSNAQTVTIRWGFEILTGAHAGRYLNKTHFFSRGGDPEKRRKEMQGFKDDLATMRIAAQSMRDFESAEFREGLCGRTLRVRQKTNVSQANGKTYVNLYINKYVEVGGETSAGRGPRLDDSTIPF
jgi:hypothetical protein